MREDTDMDTPTVSMTADATYRYDNTENAKKLYTKLSKLREISLKCDWTKDKKMMGGMASYPYLSAGKVKQNFAPLFVKAGLELDLSYGKPIQLEPIETRNSRMQHWMVELIVKIVDIDTGYGTNFCSYWGEGTDVLDKGLRKAMTAAIKSWLSDMFFLEEGIDPEVSGPTEIAGNYSPKEDPEIKSKIADAAVKPATPKAEPKEETGNQPAPAEKPAKAPRAKKEPMAKKETPEPAKPAESAPEAPAQPSAPASDLVPGSDTGYKVAGVQEKPLNKIVVEWSDALAKGKITKERYDEMATACKAISDNRTVMQFIVKYRKVE